MVEMILGSVAAIIAVIAAFSSSAAARRSLKAERQAIRQQYFSELRCWAGECSESLSSAIHWLGEGDTERVKSHIAWTELRAKLSSLIDRGRWFFPNVAHLLVGTNKEEAFRGLRPLVLDQLVYSYQIISRCILEDRSALESEARDLVKYKRSFVSEIQKKLDPRQMEEEFLRMISGKDSAD